MEHTRRKQEWLCGNFQQVPPGEETCATSPSFLMLFVWVSMASLRGWWVGSWDVSTAFSYASLPQGQEVYCRSPNALLKLGLAKQGIVWKLKKALYGLQTSPKPWEEEMGSEVGRFSMEHRKWQQKREDPNGRNPLGMVIAYVDDIIAVGEQDHLDGMRAELDKLYVVKTFAYSCSMRSRCRTTSFLRLSCWKTSFGTICYASTDLHWSLSESDWYGID